MKKILIIAFGLLVMVSCEKDETGGSSPAVWPDYLIGTWSLDDVARNITCDFHFNII